MQVFLGAISSPLTGGTSSNQAVLPAAGGFGSLLGSIQQTVQNTSELPNMEQVLPADFSAMLASLFKPVESLDGLIEEKPELAAHAQELLDKEEMPSIQDLAVLLQVDVEALQNALQKLAQLFSSQDNGEGTVKEMIDSMLQETSTGQPFEKLPLKELEGLVKLIAENTAIPFSGSDKQLISTVVRAAQLINYFAENLPGQKARFQPLQDALKNGAALLEGQNQGSSPLVGKQAGLPVIQLSQPGSQTSQASINQASLQTAFANYGSSQEPSEAANGKAASLKSAAQSVESVHPFLNQLSKAEQFAFSVKTNPRPMNMEQFIEKFTQILGNSNMVKMPNGTKMLIKLYPEQLGSLRIELLQQNGVMTAKILSSTQSVKELLEQNAHQLKHAFSQQNVTVDKIDITSPETRQQLFDRGTQQEQKQSNDQPAEQKDSEVLSSFEEALLNAEMEE